jgi:hypothetical protein
MELYRSYEERKNDHRTVPWSFISNKGMSGFVYPGYVDGKMGFYNIILDEYNIVKHRMFYPMNKVNQIWVGSPDFKIFPR